MNAGLNEAVTGIEVVKATAQEEQERAQIRAQRRVSTATSCPNGQVQARYLPMLLLAIALVGAFLHGLFLVSMGSFSVGGLVTFMGLMGIAALSDLHLDLDL